MKVDDKLILKLESLAKLKFADDDKVQLKQDLEKILNMFGKISELDTEGIEPLVYLNEHVNRLRAEAEPINESLEEIFERAPQTKDRYFLVPKVIDQ